MKSEAKKYSALTRKINQLRAQRERLTERLDELELQSILLERRLTVKVKDGATYKVRGKSPLTVRYENKLWRVYQDGKVAAVYNREDTLGLDLGKWGVTGLNYWDDFLKRINY